MREFALAIAAALVAAAVVLPRRAVAAIRPVAPSPLPDLELPPINADSPIVTSDDSPLILPWTNEPPAFVVPIPEISFEETPSISMDQKLSALLYAIRMSEHFPADVVAGRDYTTFFGGRQFSNLSDHPVATGELSGVPLPAEWCRRAGFASGRCVSTAAGAYQITLPTWREFRERGGPRLPDFSPRSQDIAAARILATLGVPALLDRGDIAGAIQRAGSRWASLPGSTSGQPQKSMSYVMAQFDNALRSA